MEQKHERPDFVSGFKKPKGTEIKYINGSWYLYERKTRYDPESKKSRKVSGKLLGKLTEKGFIPKATKITDAFEVEVREFGAFQYFYEHTGSMRERLRELFPGSWERIYTIALLRTIYGPRFKRVKQNYEDSFAELVYPGLSLSPGSLPPFLKDLGRNREKIRLFMSSMRGDTGRFILSSSKAMDNAEIGYDSKMRYKSQATLISLFSLSDDTAFPEYYKQYPGSIPDVSAFSDLLKEAGIAEDDATVIADKGVMSEEDCSLIEDSPLKYLMLLKRGNKEVRGRVPAEPLGYQGAFTFNGRSVFASSFPSEGATVHLFRDSMLYQSELDDVVARNEKRNAAVAVKAEREKKRRKANKGRLSDEELASLVSIDNALKAGDYSEMGTMTIKTNRKELSAEQVYFIYRQRQAIERYFKTYGNTGEGDDSYLRSNESLEGWLFLNHLSLMMTMDAIEDISCHRKERNCSYEDLKSLLVKVRASKFANDWHPCGRTSEVVALCADLGLDISKITVPYKAAESKD